MVPLLVLVVLTGRWLPETQALPTGQTGPLGRQGQPDGQDAMAAKAVASASNVFGMDLYEAVRGGVGVGGASNVVVSPLSASAALALALQGARNRTAQQLARALHVADDAPDAARGFRALLARTKESEQVRLRMANKVFAARTFSVRDDFRRTAQEDFRADAEAVDFLQDNEGARLAVNAWVGNATGGLIPELYAKGTLEPSTLMLLVNAIFFKGNWATPFKEENTKERPFHVTPSQQVLVPTMRDIDNETKLLIFLPDEVDGFQQLENNIRLINLDEIKFDSLAMEVQLPKFKITTNLQLKPALMKLGVDDFFDRQKANLTGISDEKGLFASKVLHRAVIEVTEKGTEAAAATSVELTNKFVPDFRVNRPFIFMLVDAYQTVLFMGRVTNPLE
ncbi:Serine protease inhibitor 77Ba [Gryllus bimaculatus]|nr:Serine protease inhibitor 77Ba [Gryllus bimaculatus]